MDRCASFLISIAALLLAATPSLADDPFTFDPPGQLVPGSGAGNTGNIVFMPGMRFPIEAGPAYANSQVYSAGGQHGPAGGQCSAANYAYPWHDDFCETRGWAMPLCPSGKGHQGQDIRPASCQKDKHWAVAAEDGTITSIGEYSVTLLGKGGTLYRYLHLSPTSLAVSKGQPVARGQRIGKISNFFGSSSTTIHLHFDVKQYVVDSHGQRVMLYVPPYTSLVDAYKRLLNGQP